MSWLQVLCDIGVNLCSDLLLIIFLGFLLKLLYRRELSKAQTFFGFKQQVQVRIYISAHEDKHTASRRVVTAVEYEAAVEVKNILRDLTGREFIRKIAGLIGQDPKLPEPNIEPAPLDEIREPINFESIILIGGPLRNQLTKFYAGQWQPLLKYDVEKRRYLELIEGQYKEVNALGIVAILVKMVLDTQVVFFAFGDGEEHTRSAARYLAENWLQLNKRFPGKSFGICLSVEKDGKPKERKVIL